MQIVTHEFTAKDLVAGHPALDFANTVTARDAADPVDWLDGYGRLLDWAALAGLADAPTLERLQALAQTAPREAWAALERAKRFREALHRIASALIAGDPLPPADLAEVEGAWKAAVERARLVPGPAGPAPAPDPEASGLDLVLDLLAAAAVDLLRDFPAPRARTCRGERCGWLFIDVSKAGRRVWCDMATCGNAAKGRRHYQRARAGVQASANIGRKKVRS